MKNAEQKVHPKKKQIKQVKKPAKKLKKPKISTKARKYVKNKVAGMSDYQAAVNAGYSKNTAVAAKQNIENPSVQELISTLMDKKGLTDDKLLQFLKDGLEKSTKIHGTDDDFVEIPDYAVRHRYLETALKLKDRFPAKTVGAEIQDGDKTLRVIIKDYE